MTSTFHQSTVLRPVIAGCMLLTFLATPISALAATNTAYQPQTTAELVAYLYGRIDQLLEMKRMLEQQGVITQAYSASSFDLVAVNTKKATEVEDTTAVLRGEVLLYGDATAKVWFEYGQDKKFLDQKTRQTTVRTAYDRAARVKVTGLEDDEYYYFRVAASDKNGTVYYGTTFTFRTDEPDYN